MIKNTMNCILASSCELRLGTEILVPGFYLTCQPGYHNRRPGWLAGELLLDAFWHRGFSPQPGKEIALQDPGHPWVGKGPNKHFG